jgi:hypothetical protein
MLFEALDIDLVLDVGANNGGHARNSAMNYEKGNTIR